MKLGIMYLVRTQNTAWKVSVYEVILVRMRENMDQNNSEYGHFSLSTKNFAYVRNGWYPSWMNKYKIA